MPGPVVHEGTTVVCSHGGHAHPVDVNRRVLVAGLPTLTVASPVVVTGCPFTGAVPMPCVTGQWLTGSTRVRALGQPLVLADSASSCEPNQTPLRIVAPQARVVAS